MAGKAGSENCNGRVPHAAPREKVKRCPGCLAGSLRCAVQALLCFALEPCQEQQFGALQFKNLWENARGG